MGQFLMTQRAPMVGALSSCGSRGYTRGHGCPELGETWMITPLCLFILQMETQSPEVKQLTPISGKASGEFNCSPNFFGAHPLPGPLPRH